MERTARGRDFPLEPEAGRKEYEKENGGLARGAQLIGPLIEYYGSDIAKI